MAEKISIPAPSPISLISSIVAKVDALMKLCDALESQLKERAEMQARLAGAVVNKYRPLYVSHPTRCFEIFTHISVDLHKSW